MTDREAMLAAICEHPADDTPRLCLADYLEESGDTERAEFIRVKEPHWPCVGLKEAANEFAALMGMPGEFGSDHGWCGGTKAKWTWRHGFIDSVRCTWADFLRVESRLIWVPGGTMECPRCGGVGLMEMMIGQYAYPPTAASTPIPCTRCGGVIGCDNIQKDTPGTGRIPRQFVSSMQPIMKVELTDWPRMETAQRMHNTLVAFQTTEGEHRFTRLKCEKCNGQRRFPPPAGGQMMPRECEKCEGQPLNEWTCDDWPVTFAMPEVQQEYRP